MTAEPMCVCRVVVEKTGNDAADYAKEHLAKGRSFLDGWATEYTCPASGKRWIRDYPHSELHGGGPPRLRVAEAVALELKIQLELVEFLLSDDRDAARHAAAIRSKLDGAFE